MLDVEGAGEYGSELSQGDEARVYIPTIYLTCLLPTSRQTCCEDQYRSGADHGLGRVAGPSRDGRE